MAEKMTLARPYAKAAFQHALSANALDSWSVMLNNMAQMVENKQVAKLVNNPTLTRSKRAEFFTQFKIFDKSFNNFINLVAEYDRLALMPQVSELFQQLKSEYHTEANVLVTSADALDEQQQKSVQASLTKKLNKKINIQFETNKDLIGGMIVKTGDVVIDGSVKGQLKKLISALVA